VDVEVKSWTNCIRASAPGEPLSAMTLNPSNEHSENQPDQSAARPGRLVSIGRLAEAAGISEHTIRVWERRYGLPRPQRTPAGHRRYSQEQLVWLRGIATLAAEGHRPGKLLRMSEDELAQLRAARKDPVPPPEAEEWIGYLRSFDGESLSAALSEAAARQELLPFLENTVSPLLHAIGVQWEEGRLDVRHEHFASALIESCLGQIARAEATASGEPLLVAALPDEQHTLGLAMVSVLCAKHGQPVTNLGANTPLEDIVRTVKEGNFKSVAISVSLANGGIVTDRKLAVLRSQLPEDVELVVGGRGVGRSRRGPRGVRFLRDLKTLDKWLRNRNATSTEEAR